MYKKLQTFLHYGPSTVKFSLPFQQVYLEKGEDEKNNFKLGRTSHLQIPQSDNKEEKEIGRWG